eukprot:TRINITY_DN1986_c0_g1_i1.p1 TRINITY_DN1986_c0_g1~~TRINITY_DN1986_c0_g1_i1.p1  ORF type:complete len:496 (-),score=119.88 TRINITY_DN1986_c0_g1_i1:650-2137(-)
MASGEVSDASEGGELLFCGATDWALIGRTDSKKKNEERAAKFPNLPGPHRIAALEGVKITFVASGCASCHCIAIDEAGRVFTWGRNENGQLGHGDRRQRNVPTLVAGLSKYKVVRAAAGRHHTVVVTSSGQSLAFGSNKHGQLGIGHLKNEAELSPQMCLVAGATDVACGAEFTVWLSNLPGASILSAGLPQYGQLGHGTDHEYNAKAGSVQLMYEAQPSPRAIGALSHKNIVKVSCGNNHSVAVDAEGFVYSWGFGGHGRLGHKEQKDEFVPRQIEQFQKYNLAKDNPALACGASFSLCTGGGGQLYWWGKVKQTGENIMYPKPFADLSGWNIRSLDAGNTSSAAAADDSCITWGTAIYGELGYGPTGPKSSAAAKKVDALNGLHTIKVACGVGHTLIVVDRSKPEDAAKIDKLPVFEIEEEEVEEEEEEAPTKAGGKRKGPPAKSPATKKAAAEPKTKAKAKPEPKKNPAKAKAEKPAPAKKGAANRGPAKGK